MDTLHNQVHIIGMSGLETQLGKIVNIDKHELVVMGDLNLDCTNKESETYKMINDMRRV